NESEGVYRTSVSKFHNRSYYLNGLLNESYIAKGSDETDLYSKTVNTYDIKSILSFDPVNNNYGLINTTAANLAATFDTGGQEGRKSAAVVLSKTQTYLYELGTTPLSTEVQFTYDKYGRVTEYLDKATATSADDYKSVITYSTNTTLINNNILNVPTDIKVYRVSPSTLLKQRTAVYNTTYGHVDNMTVKLNSSDNAVTSFLYDAYGNLKKVTLPPNAASQTMSYTYNYDTTLNKYVVSVVDDYSYTSSTTYDYRFDKPLTTTDISGNVMTYTYDNFGRTLTIKAPKEAAQSKPYTIKFEYYPKFADLPLGQSCVQSGDFVPLAITKHYDSFYPTNDIETYTLMDGLGRAVQVKKDIEMNTGSPSSPNYSERMSVSGIATYDEFGRVVEQHHPWHENKACATNYKFNEYATAYSSTTEYDELDRPIKVVDAAGGETEMTYAIANDFFSTPAVRTKTVTDQNGTADIITEVYKNITGKVTSTKNVLTGSGGSDDIWTSFTYNAIG
ncbi:MAG TPA: hypothetical protein VEA37_01100, partial [Flavobacterium sp.]|nr:hypothetical protein [Flavobacterium sp.]